ncbi:hypothetical protein ANN_20037 [Periplaneta americana]|uniref:Uncharacterized protein n=1 Tax=Periplaneta americana TaxID=6978 RepID=A0ABQ8SBQ9_PERAM|nr:hypothetical protein ANN_20037 [Periplaneta americana]
MDELESFTSHRSPVLMQNVCVSSNQPLATKAGLGMISIVNIVKDMSDVLFQLSDVCGYLISVNMLFQVTPQICIVGNVSCILLEDILERGGNAADAAVAVAAALAVTEPTSTGLGGDAFCIFYDAKTKTVKGLNGSGRCPSGLTLELLQEEGFNVHNPLPETHIHTVTVPGTVAAWDDTVQNFGSGKLSLGEILAPAISLAENGFPVTPVTFHLWKSKERLLQSRRYGSELLLNYQAPRIAEIMTLPAMSSTLKTIAQYGKSGFYSGQVAEAIVNEIKFYGGVMTLEDLVQHTSSLVEPVSTDYKGYTVWEIPPNGLGITALIALNILEGYDLKGLGLGTSEYQHLLIEALKLSFADSLYFVADPEETAVPITGLLDKQYAAERRKLISSDKANEFPIQGNPEIKRGADTVYLSVTDSEGNACSFINSVYTTFGTGVVPQGCGFALHNRGVLFSLDPSQPNCLAPGKRPQHTIIPGMLTDSASGALLASFGIMGGFMQPQAHVQVLLGMIEFGLDPQQALNLPRFFIDVNFRKKSHAVISGDLGGHVMKLLSFTPARPIQRSDISVFRYECPVTVASMKKKGPYSYRCDNAQKTFTFGESRSCSMIL